MILVDNNQILIASMFAQTRGGKEPISEDLIRHMVLNTYRLIRSHHTDRFGELVICYDASDCWRKRSFPEYKQNRKKQKAKSDVDWDEIFALFGKIREEVRTVFPYKHLYVPHAEADDVIAVMAQNYHDREKILIVSSDKDFQQLQRYPNVHQYSPIHKKMLKCEDPQRFLLEHIIKGDSSDGIPNILSDDDSIINEAKRQKPCGAKRMEKIIEELGSDENIHARNWERNQTLVDLTYIPEEIVTETINQYENQEVGDRSQILNYMIENRLKNLVEVISDF